MSFTPKSEETRRRIIEITANIFNKKGFAGTALSDLTKATKLTKGGIYGNFKNKEDIAYAAFEFNYNLIMGKVKDKISLKQSYKGKLMANIEFYYEDSADINALGGCPLLNTAIDADDTHEGLRSKAEAGLMAWKKSMTDIIMAGITHKEFGANTDVEKTALTIIAIIEGAIMLGKITRDISKQHLVLEAARELVERL